MIYLDKKYIFTHYAIFEKYLLKNLERSGNPAPDPSDATLSWRIGSAQAGIVPRRAQVTPWWFVRTRNCAAGVRIPEFLLPVAHWL